MDEIKLIAGLGNPDKEYEGTRHNIGFEVVDTLAEKFGAELKKGKFGASFGQAVFEDKKLILLKPLAYMNNSGQVITTVAGFYRLEPQQILVITDDLALEPGLVRIRASGSAGGHNGLADIVAKLGTENFSRLRVGIGDKGQSEGRDYVLSRPSQAQRELLNQAVAEAVEAIIFLLRQGVDAAMTKFNRKNIGQEK
jgi:PTH1 family peptidyl-tRNA hydrolase